MTFGTGVAFIELLLDLISRRTGELGRVNYAPQKPSFDPELKTLQPLPRSLPEKQGVSSAWVEGLVRELGETASVHMHQIVIVRHGHIIYEGAYAPYETGVWHATYSMCKSFVGMAIGILAGEGLLSIDDPVLKYFPEQRGPVHSLRFKGLTVRHLLTMTSGSGYNEIGAISGNNWVDGFFSAPLKDAPGSRFAYNSMNTFLLSAIVQKITGMTLHAFLQEKLFAPMGIRQTFWETSPTGITKGGWGMYLLPEDAAKLGQLYLQNGLWNGQQLVPKKWVQESTRLQVSTGKVLNPGYGYQLWMDFLPESYVFNGMLGQNVHVFPTLDLVLVTNAGNGELFADTDGVMTGILRKYIREELFSPDVVQENPGTLPGPVSYSESTAAITHSLKGGWGRKRTRTGKGVQTRMLSSVQRRGPAFEEEVQKTPSAHGVSFQELYQLLEGKSFVPEDCGAGLMPLILQVVHNNYTRGITQLRFVSSEEGYCLQVREGAALQSLPIGTDQAISSRLDENGEEYLVATKARAALDEDGVPVLILTISFTEEAAERILKIRIRSPRQLELDFSETPGDMIITSALGAVSKGGRLMHQLTDRLSPEAIHQIIRTTISPVIMAHRAKEPEAIEQKAPGQS